LPENHSLQQKEHDGHANWTRTSHGDQGSHSILPICLRKKVHEFSDA
jgi:hypothetical protein